MIAARKYGFMDSAGFDKIDGAFQRTTQSFGKIEKLIERRQAAVGIELD